MMAYSSFAEMEALAGKEPPSRLCVAGGNDPGVIEAVIIALRKGLISEAIITGDAASIRAAIPAELAPKLTLIGAGEPGDCARLAVRKMREGEADILMKGHIDSTSYLRAIVDRGERHPARWYAFQCHRRRNALLPETDRRDG